MLAHSSPSIFSFFGGKNSKDSFGAGMAAGAGREPIRGPVSQRSSVFGAVSMRLQWGRGPAVARGLDTPPPTPVNPVTIRVVNEAVGSLSLAESGKARPAMRLAATFLAATLALPLALGACATRPPATDREALEEFQANNDPIEPFNRAMFAVNGVIDTVAVRPVAVAYRYVVPPPLRVGIRNALGNLRAPTILMNDVLQGSPERAFRTGARFLINSTLGVGGLFDVAEWQFGLPGHAEDFGQTLAVWGIGEGPYLFLPVVGPTNPRDLVGIGVDAVASPWFWFGQGEVVEALRWARFGLTILDAREGVLDTLDEVARTSLDPYATIRSGYRQRRAAEIANRGDGSSEAATGTGFGVGTGFFSRTPSDPAPR